MHCYNHTTQLIQYKGIPLDTVTISALTTEKMAPFVQVFFLALTLAAAIGQSAVAQGRVILQSLHKDKLHAIYHGSEGEGIRISSEVKGDEADIKIQNFAGDVLFSLFRPDANTMLLDIMGHQFLVIDVDKRKLAGFAIPSHLTKSVWRLIQKKKFKCKVS